MIEPQQRATTLPTAGTSSDEGDGAFLRSVIDLLEETCRLFGFVRGDWTPDETLRTWQRFSSSGQPRVGAMAWVKYKLPAYFAAHTGQDLPKAPVPGDNPRQLACGRLGRFMEHYLRRNDYRSHCDDQRRRAFEFLTTILLLKKGCPRPGKDALEKAVLDTFNALTTHTDPVASIAIGRTDVWGDDSLVTFSELGGQVARTVRELFDGIPFTESDLYRPYLPSPNANYSYTKKRTGTFGAMLEGDLPWPDELDEGRQDLNKATLIRKVRKMHYQDYNAFCDQFPLELRDRNMETLGLSYDEESIRDTWGQSRFKVSTQLEEVYRLHYERVRAFAMTEEPRVVPVPLAEALKVRVISKGPPATYFCLKPVQRFMWKHMKKHPTFELIGKQVSSDMVETVLGKSPPPGMKWLSGDYKAATDNLRKELTRIAWHTFCDCVGIEGWLRELGVRALTDHILELWKKKKLLKEAKQEAGQLMGSIISFPILCIVNAAVCRWVMELDGQATTPWGLPLAVKVRTDNHPGWKWQRHAALLVNGDDCAFPVSERGRWIWKELARMAGLQESVGKTYFSDIFVNINSTNFVRLEGGEDGIDGRLHMTGYINTGLILGMERSMSKSAPDEDNFAYGLDFDLSERAWELIRLAGGCAERGALMGWFRRANAKALDAYTNMRIPWFVPRRYGGLGLPEWGDMGMSVLDRKVVWHITHETTGFPEAVALRAQGKEETLRQIAVGLLRKLGLDMTVSRRRISAGESNVESLACWVYYCNPETVRKRMGLQGDIVDVEDLVVRSTLTTDQRVKDVCAFWKKAVNSKLLGPEFRGPLLMVSAGSDVALEGDDVPLIRSSAGLKEAEEARWEAVINEVFYSGLQAAL